MRLRTDRGGGRLRVRVAGEVATRDLPRLRASLLRAFEAGERVVLDGRSLDDIDLPLAQLIVAAARSARDAGKVFEAVGCEERILTAMGVSDGEAVEGLGMDL